MKVKQASGQSGALGTAHLKSLIKDLIKCVQQTATVDANQNGKISLIEALSVMASFGFKIPAIYNAIPEVKAEWKDLTPEELEELVVWFTEEFDLPRVEHGKLEAIIKKSVAIIVDNYNHIQDLKSILSL